MNAQASPQATLSVPPLRWSVINVLLFARIPLSMKAVTQSGYQRFLLGIRAGLLRAFMLLFRLS